MLNSKILLIDVETAPNIVYAWGLYDQNISIDQIVQDGYMLCWSAKWFGSKEIIFDSIFNYTNFVKNPTDDYAIALSAWKLMDEADIIIAHNGDHFDLKWFNTLFLKHGLKPVSTYKSIDTLKAARTHFKFLSNRLDYISRSLGVGEKLKHEGFSLWTKCMKGCKEAWKKMEMYNKRDVQILEDVYKKLRPFIKNHPNVGLYGKLEESTCPACNCKDVSKRGYSFTNTGKYARFVCNSCGKWFRSRINVLTDEQKANLNNGL